MKLRLKNLATLNVDCTLRDERPFIALEHVEGWTGSLVQGIELPIRAPAQAGMSAVEPGDVLFGKLRPYLAKSWVVDRPALASTELMCLRPRRGTDSRWLGYLLRASPFIDWAVTGSEGTKMPRTSWEKVCEYRTSVLSPVEQRAIADYLDSETARINGLISKKRRLTELLHERRAAYVGSAVVIGLDNRDDLVETGNHHVPQLPSGWRLMRLRHVVEQIIDTPHKTAPVVDDKEYLVVRTANVKTGRLVFDDARYTDRASWIEWNRRGEPCPGDVMFTREAPAGEACVVPAGVPLCIGQRMVLFRVNPAVACGEWIVHSIYSGPAQRFIEELSNETTVAHLNMSDIHDIPIAVPDKDEQQQILAQVRREVRRHEEAVSKLDEQINLLAERRQALITAVVTGEMPVPGAST